MYISEVGLVAALIPCCLFLAYQGGRLFVDLVRWLGIFSVSSGGSTGPSSGRPCWSGAGKPCEARR